MKKYFLFLVSSLLFAEPLEIKLEKVEEDALRSSKKLRAAEFNTLAADSRTSASKSLRYPRLTLDGSYKYLKEIPSITIPGAAMGLSFGDHNNYSIGPTLNYTLLDFGAISNTVRSSEFAEKAREKEFLAVKQEVLLQARTTYFAVQLAVERMRLTLDSLLLAVAQNNDINKRTSAGLASALDAISSHRQVLQLKLSLSKVQSELAAELINLFNLISYKDFPKNLLPAESSFYKNMPEDLEKVNLVIALDSIDNCIDKNSKRIKDTYVSSNPRIDALNDMVSSSSFSARAYSSDLWPKLMLSGRISRDYPNGPVLNPFTQAMVGVTLSMPLFEAGKTSSLSEQKEYETQFMNEQKQQLQDDLNKDLYKAKSQLNILYSQKNIAELGSGESEKISDMTYKAYKSGTKSFLEVQSRNLETLQWKVELAVIKTQMLMQMAVIENLSAEDFK